MSANASSNVDSDTPQAPSNDRGHREPPLYQIDLSLPPQSRYLQICNEYKNKMEELIGIYDQLLSLTPSPRFFAFLAKRLLKRVHSEEETQEIVGISKATGIPIHLVVAYNTFLDLLSGCMSGGAQVKIPGVQGTRMIHFRNLDWDMDILRDMIIRVEYVLGGKVIARAVTYAGYVGVLTGVREGLSISLNYRIRIQSRTSSSTLSTLFHYLLLLLAHRPSISSQLRQILLSPGPQLTTLPSLTHHFTHTLSSSCYLTFCTPSSVLVLEKDLKTTVTHTSNRFLAVTNHDVAMEEEAGSQPQHQHQQQGRRHRGGRAAMRGVIRQIMEESMERKECICGLWRARVGGAGDANEGDKNNVGIEDIKSWLRRYPIRNECTHFSCIMDPSVEGGGLVWVETCVQ